ncbi:Protein of unknown function [Pyronema omphalodes CBS 100304]|uniref:Uncharacterized protein n=1 Tax=Pyronema omphalodes (strain CBS 100304) TaxID=1076935 RepID=U4KZZ7_PYROM|nr:Protein of unknown function [Pyronema omphalodes CBS 100304]
MAQTYRGISSSNLLSYSPNLTQTYHRIS